jgi:hypothetical protein
MPAPPMVNLATKVAPSTSLAFAQAAREAKMSESTYLRHLVTSDPATAKRISSPESRRRFKAG